MKPKAKSEITLDRGILSKACNAVGAALTSTANQPDAWLTVTCERLVEIIGDDVAAQAWVTLAQGSETPLRVLHAAAAGGLGKAAGKRSSDDTEKVLRSARDGFPEDDVTDAIHLHADAGALHAIKRSNIASDNAWQSSKFRRARAAMGLYDFARATAPLQLVEGPGALTLQIDGLSPSWRPDELTLCALQAVTPALARGFDARFVGPSRRRSELLESLSEAQKRIAPLLAEGCTEREIAERLKRSVHTVHEYTREIYRALGVCSRREMRDIWFGLRPGPESNGKSHKASAHHRD